MRKGKSNITPELADKVRGLYSQGMRKSHISRELGISRASVTRIVGDRRPGVHPYRRRRAVALYVRHGMKQLEIAAALGVSPAFVCNAMKGVEKRPRPKKAKPKVSAAPVLKTMKRRPGRKPEPLVEDESPKVFAMRPPVREGTRPVQIKPGLVIHASVSEPEESVRERYRVKFGIGY